MAVYFIRSPHGFKIGFSDNVPARVKQLQTGSQSPLELVAVIAAGTRAVEQELHRVLAASRAAGEWFKPTALVRYAVHQAQHGWGPSLAVHVRAFERHALMGKKQRICAGILPSIPRRLRGTEAEHAIMDLDAFIRAHGLPYPPTLGRAFATLRKLMNGTAPEALDLSVVVGFTQFRRSVNSASAAPVAVRPE